MQPQKKSFFDFSSALGLYRQNKILVSLFAVIIIILISLALYSLTKAKDKTGYYLVTAKKGNLELSVTGSGNIASRKQTDLKPGVTERISKIYVNEGDIVKEGQIIAVLDSTDARKNFNDARTSLETASLSLEKIKKAPDNLAVNQAANSLEQARLAKEKAKSELDGSLADAFAKVSSIFMDLPGIISSAENIISKNSLSGAQDNLTFYINMGASGDEKAKSRILDSFNAARNSYSDNLPNFQKSNRNDGPEKIKKLLDETYETEKAILDAIAKLDVAVEGSLAEISQDSQNEKLRAAIESQNKALKTYISKINTDLSGLLTVKSNIVNAENAISEADGNESERKLNLTKQHEGAALEDILYQEYATDQAQINYNYAYAKLGDYSIRAPFSGRVAKVYANEGDYSSPTTAIVALLSEGNQVSVFLNEMEVSKVSSGQKAVITLDAIPGIEIPGVVDSVDSFGANSQGVVSFGVKILPDEVDERVRPGMSASAKINLQNLSGVVYLPNEAVKTTAGKSYVEIFPDIRGQFSQNVPVTPRIKPSRREVVVGASNESFTEIKSGLEEGDVVVLRKTQIK